MCGIVGYFSTGRLPGLDVLKRMNRCITRRGPDEEGYFHNGRAALAARRLSIVGIENGRQPVQNERGDVQVVVNGEIYNYQQIKQSLRARGHVFATDTDSEVIAHLYEEYGEDLVHHLRGMFAFALWDDVRKKAILARDHLGIKPLYYTHTGGDLLFASELKGLLSSGVVAREIDLQALDAFLAFTYVPAPLTIFRSVSKLPPGSLLIYQDGELTTRQYWEVDFRRKNTDHGEDDWVEILAAALSESVGAHLQADVPVGSFLSGGVDSGLVTAMANEKLPYTMQTFTMGFRCQANPLVDEREYARRFTQHQHIAHHEIEVSAAAISAIDDIVTAFDEPFADDSVFPSYFIFQKAAEQVKVALSGLGGDELLGGYRRHRGFALSDLFARLPGWLRTGLVAPAVGALPEPRAAGEAVDHLKRFVRAGGMAPEDRYLSYVSSLDAAERRCLYQPDIAAQIDFEATGDLVRDPIRRCNAESALEKILYCDLKTSLPDDLLALSDRLGMWHSLEVRVPLADYKLVELCATIPARMKLRLFGRQKHLLHRVSERWLPQENFVTRKQGFESPMGSWLRRELRLYAVDLLSSTRFDARGLLSPVMVTSLLDQHLSGKHKHNKILFSLLMFELWARRYQDLQAAA